MRRQSSSQDQSQKPPGTIRVRVRLIPVDVIVTDGRGRPVTNLKQENFEVFEDGRLQEIRHFSVQDFTEFAPEAQPIPIPRPVAATEPVPQHARTFLIVMGRGDHQLFKAVDCLIRFVRNDLLPQDRVAVFAYNRATDFTTDHEQIAQVLERYKKYNNIQPRLRSALRGPAPVYGTAEIPKSVQADIDKLVANPPELQSRQLVTALAGKTTPAQTSIPSEALKHKMAGLMRIVIPGDKTEMERADRELLAGGLSFGEWWGRWQGTKQDIENLFTCIEYLRYLEGEKHLLFFTGTGLILPYGNSEFDNVIARIANDARVTIDVFQTGGIDLRLNNRYESIDLSRYSLSVPATTWAVQSVRNIAELTGGRAAIYQDIGAALNSVNEATRVQYLLGYYPRDDSWNGKYRRIDVKVKRPGLKVSFRHGYYASDTLQPFDREEFMAYNRITAAGEVAADIPDIPFSISASHTGSGSEGQEIRLDLRINCARVGFDNSEGTYKGKLRIATFYADAKGGFLGEVWDSLALNFSEERFLHARQTGFAFSRLIPFKTPNQIIKVVIYDPATDLLGSRQLRLK